MMDDVACRRHAVQLAAQLPEDRADAMRVIEHLKALAAFMSEGGAVIAIVARPTLRPVS